MSAENKKLLWISLSACVFVLVLAGAGFFLFAPKKGGSAAPATMGNTAIPKASDPQDFLLAPPPLPSAEQPSGKEGSIVVIYGDKPPASPEPAPGAALETTQAPAKVIVKPTSPPPAKAALETPAKSTSAAKTAAKTVRIDEYWIQAASFTSRARADELRELLAAKGVAALISVKDIDGKSWYRVRVGPYGGRPEAEGWLGRLKSLPNCAEAYVSKIAIERKP